MPIAFFTNALHDIERLEENARRIFPWWDKHLDRRFWTDTLRAMLWTDVCWRAPRTPWESFAIDAANSAANRLDLTQQQDLQVGLCDLNKLAENPDDFTLPSAQGIGYRRKKIAYFLTGPWRINLPGSYVEQQEEDGSTICLWFGSEEIRGSSWTHKDDHALSWHESLEGRPTHVGSTCTYRVGVTKKSKEVPDAYLASANFYATNQGEGKHLLHLSLFTFDPNAHDRLTEIANGVWASPPQKPPPKPRDA